MTRLVGSSLVFANPQWTWVAVLLFLAAAVLIFLGYRESHLRGPWKITAIGLKILAFILLIPGPARTGLGGQVSPEWFQRPGSHGRQFPRSLHRRPGRRMKAALGDADNEPAWMDELGELFRLQRYQFDRRLRRVDDFSGLDFTGDASSILTSVKSLKNRYRKRPLAAMVLLTDGNATDTAAIESLVETLAESESEDKEPVPVFPVLVGKKLDKARDLAIRDISVSQSAFEDAPLTIRVKAQARGKFEKGVEVFVLDEKGGRGESGTRHLRRGRGGP